MSTSRFTLTRALPLGATAAALASDVAAGLSSEPKSLPPRWFYDAHGSALFEEITALPEYYPTRAEHEILTRRAAEIARLTRARTLIELGSGSSAKTGLLLDALPPHLSYVPVDVSQSALEAAGRGLLADRPELRVHALVADFQDGLELPDCPGPRLVAFLGGTIGNLLPAERARFLTSLRSLLAPDDALLLGTDLVKDPTVLVAAYDDARGVTARFNKNVLRVLARELDADCDPADFDHVAVWDPDREWIEMRLRARTALTVKIRALGSSVDFKAGEELRTEISAKFRPEGLRTELAAAGWRTVRCWTDARDRFALSLALPEE
ncbi:MULTISPECIES: L-histidine N(alpha)-methyltransferase [unclassified Streptomyces]|uniref:L-histidine N(alpha)-methyltransferase n=1 Tax=unclassified Streptomyces TaxID=2593676 RepID=UPI002DDA5C5F|nr:MULTISPECIES: L-histidine N(alpha)-methyltransferase [unclassified Streptomyces]WSA90299.1 L-histidine N(alpha)-methyltransferase [Streptomyces sp. NBC_01795]WSB74524.1 L-histidine N(alpha)-methyltransferase [Streptomyces sp. NBC_01775]WSS17091.1 L-histidine N(alpha)-methyltransferase [Streptomyces sp. NBC_01186]WSS45835.1 L-histidine N(alpha)-methyltransferase [Streptomyces sp. NBC_01187]